MGLFTLLRFQTPNNPVAVSELGPDLSTTAALGQAVENFDTYAARINGTNTFSALQTFSSGISPNGTNTLTLPAATDTIVGKATTDILTNKTLTSPSITGATLTTTASIGMTGGITWSGGAALTSGAQFSVNLGANNGLSAIGVNASETDTLSGATGNAYAASFGCAPTYTAATAQTLSRHNYIYLANPVLTGVGPAALTDACVFDFPAAVGTHKAIDSGSTKTSPGTVSAWMKININDTVYYMPAYTSKTS